MCASARNVIIPHPTPPHPMMLRSTDHVCKYKKSWCCVAATMCASARNVIIPHPTPPHPTMWIPGKPPVPRDSRDVNTSYSFGRVIIWPYERRRCASHPVSGIHQDVWKDKHPKSCRQGCSRYAAHVARIAQVLGVSPMLHPLLGQSLVAQPPVTPAMCLLKHVKSGKYHLPTVSIEECQITFLRWRWPNPASPPRWQGRICYDMVVVFCLGAIVPYR